MLSSTRTVAVSGGGGGGGPALTVALNGGKFSTGGATTLVITPQIKPSTNSVIIVGALVGQTTTTSLIDNRGNVFMQDKFDDRLTGACVAIWHFVATATYNGAYTITLTVPVSAPIVAGLLIASNTQNSVSVDVTTNSFKTGAVIEIGTSAVTSAATDIVFSVMVDNSGVNDAITPRAPSVQVAEEQDGSSFQAGSIIYSTQSVQNAVTSGNWNLAASKTANTVTVGYKTP